MSTFLFLAATTVVIAAVVGVYWWSWRSVIDALRTAEVNRNLHLAVAPLTARPARSPVHPSAGGPTPSCDQREDAA